jgi:protein disulfide-isomerase
MNKPIKLAFFAAFAFSLFASARGSDAVWLTSYNEAVKQSQKTGKPIMADFTGSDWCKWCVRLHEEVFSKPEFKKWAAQNVVLLELDFPQHTAQPKALQEQNESLERKYQSILPGFPTILFLNPDGTVFGKYNYEPGGPIKWTRMASRLLPLQKAVAKK